MIRETPYQKALQVASVEVFARERGWHCLHTPDLFKVDAFFFDPDFRTVAIGEFKGRGYSSSDMTRLGTFLIDEEKMGPAHSLALEANVPLYLLAGLEDGLFAARVDNKAFTKAMGGRNDREVFGQERDFEPCRFYNFELFKRVGG